MFRRIKDFDGTPAFNQIRKSYEELDELAVEVTMGNIPGIRSEGADLIQTVITLWLNMGYNLNDIEEIFRDLYVKESKRGRIVECIDGEDNKDLIIADLLDTIAKKDRIIRNLKDIINARYKSKEWKLQSAIGENWK